VQAQFKPLLVTFLVPVQFGVIPVGRTSLIVVVPKVVADPELVAVKVYSALDCPIVHGPLF
jgi:hypothetical protein